jgi:hypothetical protein
VIEVLVESINKLTYGDEIDSFIKRSIEKLKKQPPSSPMRNFSLS